MTTTVKIVTIATGQISTHHFINDREEAIKQGKWYAAFKENGRNKYRAFISN